MRRFKKLSILLMCLVMLAAIFAGCQKEAAPAATEAPVVTEAPTEEPTAEPEEELSVDIEADFFIENMEDGIKKVIDGEGRELILVPREMEVPAEYADSIVVRTPIENAVFLSTTQVCSMRLLNDDIVWDAIGGVGGAAETWGDIPAVAERVESGKIANVGGTFGDPDYEVISGLNPDLVFVYTGSWPQTGVIEKLDELGINYAVDNEYMETDYMARMAWSEFILSFYNLEDEAAELLAKASENVEAMKEKVAGEEQPKVIFASEYNGVVSVSAPDSWLGNMIMDAGADYMFKDTPVDGLSLSMEDFIAAATEADIIVYTSNPLWMPDKTTLFSAIPLLKDVPAVQNGKLYQYTDAFWMGIDKTDVMAEDMAAIFYPALYPDRELTFFTEIAE